jgi:hypothetical protein
MPETAAPPAPPAGRVVRVAVTAELLLGMLCIDDGELIGAAVENAISDQAMLVLYVDHPHALARADELEPVYERIACPGDGSCPGRVTLTGLTWKRGGFDLPSAPGDAC